MVDVFLYKVSQPKGIKFLHYRKRKSVIIFGSFTQNCWVEAEEHHPEVEDRQQQGGGIGEEFDQNIQFVGNVLFDEVTQTGVIFVAETDQRSAHHSVPLPQTYQDHVLLLVLYLPGQFPQTVQVQGGFLLSLHLRGRREVQTVESLVEEGVESHLSEEGHREEQEGQIGGDEVELAGGLGQGDHSQVEFHQKELASDLLGEGTHVVLSEELLLCFRGQLLKRRREIRMWMTAKMIFS